MKTYDLRSDTITKPDEGMRKAMYRAEVGDDVYHEDPTVNKLEEMASNLTGKERAIFVTSGSMGNLIPTIINCGRGNELLIDYRGHMIHYELASVSAIAGALPVGVVTKNGILSSKLLKDMVRPDIYYMARTKMIVIENTHNLAGGTYYKRENLRDIRDFASKHSLTVHMDGARVFNASAASGIEVSEISKHADTVTFCLSKGLGAPVGALLCGDKNFIDEARRVRKMLGGGMRQAGILAAAGIYALEHNAKRLSQDHEKAKIIAKALDETEWAEINPDSIVTNIIYFNTENPQVIAEKLKQKGVLCGVTGKKTIRMVTHINLSMDDTGEICEIIKNIRV